MQHASASRHGGAPAAGLAASRHPRRDRQQLHRCSGGLRLPAAPCSAGVPLQAQMLAAWRRPPRGALVGPRCQGRIRSERPFKAPNGHGGRSRARRPSGEPGLRGVARVDLCIAREIVREVCVQKDDTHRGRETRQGRESCVFFLSASRPSKPLKTPQRLHRSLGTASLATGVGVRVLAFLPRMCCRGYLVQTRNFLVRPLNLIFRQSRADDMPTRPR